MTETLNEQAERVGTLLGIDINLYKSDIPVRKVDHGQAYLDHTCPWQVEVVFPTGDRGYGLQNAEIGEVRAFINGMEFCGLNAEVKF